jgi:peptidoglycan-N-acetylglucosamine deacetylase
VATVDPDFRARRRAAAARRRQLQRRRLVAALIAVAVVVLLVVIVSSLGGGSAKPKSSSTQARQQGGGGERPTRTPRKPQAGSDNAAVLSVAGYLPAIAKGGGRSKDIALTFDDGPGPDTPRIVSILKRYHVPGTFFVMGRSLQSKYGKPGLQAITSAGFAVGDHTMTHPPMAQLSASAQRQQISGVARLLESMGQPRPVMFRPPYGSFNDTTLRVLKGERMLGVVWSADTKDFERPGVKQIQYTGISAAQPGAIVLMHDGPDERSQTAAALPRIITRLRQRGYRLVTVPQMLKENPPRRGTPVPTSLSGGA